jgi:hypothetical protein
MIFLCAYLNKHQTVYSICEENACLYAHLDANMHLFVFVIICELVNLNMYCGLERMDVV